MNSKKLASSPNRLALEANRDRVSLTAVQSASQVPQLTRHS